MLEMGKKMKDERKIAPETEPDSAQVNVSQQEEGLCKTFFQRQYYTSQNQIKMKVAELRKQMSNLK